MKRNEFLSVSEHSEQELDPDSEKMTTSATMLVQYTGTHLIAESSGRCDGCMENRHRKHV